MPTPIDFYFDFSSPYAYLGSHLIGPVAKKHSREVHWHPFMLGVAMKGEKTFPLTQYPKKGEYSRMDFDRTARRHNIPFNMPTDFPKATLAASRGYLWIAQDDEAVAVAFAQKVFAAYFVENHDISDPEIVADIASDCGVDRSAFLEAIQSPAIKDAFKNSVEEIVSGKKVFGAPYFVVDGEAFWALTGLANWMTGWRRGDGDAFS